MILRFEEVRLEGRREKGALEKLMQKWRSPIRRAQVPSGVSPLGAAWGLRLPRPIARCALPSTGSAQLGPLLALPPTGVATPGLCPSLVRREAVQSFRKVAGPGFRSLHTHHRDYPT